MSPGWAPRRLVAGLVSTAAPSLLVLTFLSRASQNAAQTTYPLIGRDLLGMGQFAIGGVAACAGVANVFCSSVVVGRARHRPAASILAGGQVLALASFVLLTLPAGRIGLWVGAIGLGAATGLVFPSLMTVIAGRSAGRRTKALTLMSVALSASLVTGPLLEAGALGALGDTVRRALAALVVLPAAAAVLAARAARRAHRQADADPPPDGTDEPVPPGGAGAGGERLTVAFRMALTVMLTYQVPFAALVAFGALLARHADGVSASGAEVAFGVFFAASAAVRLGLAAVTPDRRLGAVLAASAVLTVVGVAGVGLARDYGELLGAMAVLGIPHGTTFPLASSILAEHAHADGRSLIRANGRLMAGTNGATVVVPFACGWIASMVGYRSMFVLLEVPVVMASALLVHQLRSPRSPLRPDAVTSVSPAGG
jgi:DHA1 family multidrug resistance protein-like MFS transporter